MKRETLELIDVAKEMLECVTENVLQGEEAQRLLDFAQQIIAACAACEKT